MVGLATSDHVAGSAFRRFFGTRQRGWIGVDVGTSRIKLAQVEYDAGAWRLVASRVVPIAGSRGLDAESLADGLVGKLVRDVLRQGFGFHGCRVACVLPTSVTDLQSFELPDGSDVELRQMVSHECQSAGDDEGEEREAAFWKVPKLANDRHEMTQVAVLSLARRVAGGVAEDFLRAGLQCQVLDGLPFALSRAVNMAGHGRSTTPQAAVDWGYSSPVFTVVADGRPVFSRILRDCGLRHLLESVSKRLQLAPDESWRLLSAYGFSQESTRADAGNIRELLYQLTCQPLQEFVQELQKTLSFLRQQHPALLPERIWLLGGGATIPHVAERITGAAGVETAVWKVAASRNSTGSTDSQTALFGQAMALSALGVVS